MSNKMIRIMLVMFYAILLQRIKSLKTVVFLMLMLTMSSRKKKSHLKQALSFLGFKEYLLLKFSLVQVSINLRLLVMNQEIKTTSYHPISLGVYFLFLEYSQETSMKCVSSTAVNANKASVLRHYSRILHKPCASSVNLKPWSPYLCFKC